MCCVRGSLTFHFENKAVGGPLIRNMNLNGIINICIDYWQGRPTSMGYHFLRLSKRQEKILSNHHRWKLDGAYKIPTKYGDSCIGGEIRFVRLISFFVCTKMAKGRAWVSFCILSMSSIISSNLLTYFSPMTTMDHLLWDCIPDVWRFSRNLLSGVKEIEGNGGLL